MHSTAARTEITSPPAGTGNVPGLGETFRINLNTGQGVYTYKFPLPEGVAGLKPQLSLEYSHGIGHGIFGFGWKLSVRSITRRLDFGAPEEGAVERYADSGGEIVPSSDGSFRAVHESSFTRYWPHNEGWKIEDRNGLVHELGIDTDCRVKDPAKPERTIEWLIEKTLDASGNTIEYLYAKDADNQLLSISEIRYAIYRIRFVYEDRPDCRTDGRSGFLRSRGKRCSKIELLYVDDDGSNENLRLVRSWQFSYQVDRLSQISLLSSIQMVSYGREQDGSGDVVRAPVRFGYSTFKPEIKTAWIISPQGSSPPPLTDLTAALLTLDNAPLPGILQTINGRQYYWPNAGNLMWGHPVPIRNTPEVTSFEKSGTAFIDIDSSGTADLLVPADSALRGYYENGGEDGWTRFVQYPRENTASPAWTSGRVRLTDSNGNGSVDAIMSNRRYFSLWFNQGEEGWSSPMISLKGTGPDRPDVDFADLTVHLADMNGDGIADLVRVQSGKIEYWPSFGYGKFGPKVVMRNNPRLRNLHSAPENLMFADVNGDGCADMVSINPSGGIELFINQNGISFADPVVMNSGAIPIPGSIRPADMKGAGRSGVVWNSYSGRRNEYIYVELGSPFSSSSSSSLDSVPYLLTSVDNGSGLISEISYRPAIQDYLRDKQIGERWQTNFPFPLTVVAGTKEVDIVSGQTTEILYMYHGAHYEYRQRQFQGFQRTERIEKGDDSRPDTLTVFHFLMGQEKLPANGPEHAALNGLLYRTETYSLDGSAKKSLPYRMEESSYGLRILEKISNDQPPRVFVYVASRKIEDYDRTRDVRGEMTSYSYDDFGNVTTDTLVGYGTRGEVAQQEKRRITRIEYSSSITGRWILDKPSRIVLQKDDGSIISEKRRYYDGSDFVGLPLGQMDRGLLTREERLVMNANDFASHYSGMDATPLGYVVSQDFAGNCAVFVNSERHSYNDRGLKTADRDPIGINTKYSYDDEGLFRVKVKDSLGKTQIEYDYTTGQPLKITYADSSKAEFTYDGQGRVRSIFLPGGVSLKDGNDSSRVSARAYQYDDSSVPTSRTVTYRSSDSPDGVSTSVTYFDGRGQEFQHRIEYERDRYVVSGLEIKNPWGQTKREFEPTFSSDPAFSIPQTAGRTHRSVYYDAVGRITKTVNYNGGISSAEYHPFEILTWDANDTDESPENKARGHFDTPKCEEFDVLRLRSKVIETIDGGKKVTTSFVFDISGNLLEVRDDRGVMCTYKYDLVGNRLAIRHREAGSRFTWYDARRLAIRNKDSAGNDILAEIDSKKRLKRLVVNGSLKEEYFYDDPARHALGRLSTAVYEGGKQTFTYDLSGKLVTQEYHSDGQKKPLKLSFEYDLLDREIAIVHNDGTRITKQLTLNGWVKSIPGYLDDIKYDVHGLPTKILYANGVITELVYNESTRIKSQKTTLPSGKVVEEIGYNYDKQGLLLLDKNTAQGSRWERSFVYDPLYQIRQAITKESGATKTIQYDYAENYNISKLGETGSILSYDDALHPDRVAGVTQASGARKDINYDGNGNLTAISGKSFKYNFKNELTHFTRAGRSGISAEYRYDHLGKRIFKRVNDGHGNISQTFFLGDLAEVKDGKPAYFIRLGRLLVAIVADGIKRFIHNNYLGNSTFFTDDAGTKISAIAYQPFGNLISITGNVSHRTFGTHQFDTESGLYYMYKRYFAPEIGRFLTPDPVALYQSKEYLSNPKSLHPYSYVANDPLNNIDFDGLSFWSVVGAIVGVIAAIAVAIAVAALVVMTGGLLGILLGATLVTGLVTISYVVADATAGSAFGEFMRGFMIGLNAGLNAIIATALFGPVVGITLGVINFLAAFDTIANSAVYQGILGWSSWLMPMSWLATGLGLAFFIVNLVVMGITFNQWEAARIREIRIDWRTGTIVTHGGLFTVQRGGYNLGNFAYIHRDSMMDAELIGHETGHTLNVAAFGSIFHYIGAIDENVIGRYERAYAERLAESHARAYVPTTPPTDLPMWE
jgi:RHS repeat-associated protein